jgi:hypothetical protein
MKMAEKCRGLGSAQAIGAGVMLQKVNTSPLGTFHASIKSV